MKTYDSHFQVKFLLAWSLLLTHLQSLPPLSLARERLVQYLQDSTNPSIILDALFQHIPLKSGSTLNLKKKETELPAEISRAAAAAKQAITSRSLLFAIKSLWPAGSVEIAALSGAIYGLLICVLPAYVRNWFSGLRDRSTLLSIESFTKSWCSPHLLSDEMSQVPFFFQVSKMITISLAYKIHLLNLLKFMTFTCLSWQTILPFVPIVCLSMLSGNFRNRDIIEILDMRPIIKPFSIISYIVPP